MNTLKDWWRNYEKRRNKLRNHARANRYCGKPTIYRQGQSEPTIELEASATLAPSVLNATLKGIKDKQDSWL
jgi:hypothetical protein